MTRPDIEALDAHCKTGPACTDTLHNAWPAIRAYIAQLEAERDAAQMVRLMAGSFEAGERAEREAVVAWLRDSHDGRLVSRMWLADAIERGEHMEARDDAR
jgi:hypothetical protein